MIELLVVISIIGVLASTVLASLNSARLKARNAARLSDINTLRTAFNLGAGDNGVFPTTGGYVCISAICYQGWAVYVANASVDAFLAPYLPSKPSDPTGGSRGYGGYLYINPATLLGVTGAYIDYLVESPGSCGAAFTISSNANYSDCYLKID